MDFIQDALLRAKQEGKIDPKKLPWDKPQSSTPKRELQKCVSPRPSVPKELFRDFQKIIENIYSITKQNKTQVIGVTSALPGEGTSTIISIVSYLVCTTQNGFSNQTISEIRANRKNGSGNGYKNKNNGRRIGYKHKALLIDTVVDSPRLHKIFGIPAKPGICEYLSAQTTRSSVVKKINRINSDLHVIPAGSEECITPNQMNIEKITTLIQDNRSRYKYIFLDIPPILHHPNGMLLSQICDGIIVVVRAGQTKLEVVQETKRLLKKSEINVIGSVLNRRKFYVPDMIYKRL